MITTAKLTTLPQQQATLNILLEQYITKYCCNSPLYDAIKYSTLGKSKRLRPLILLSAAAANNIEHVFLNNAAVAIELIHCYSLVHDDLPAMDDDDFRRGKPSCHKAYSEATAILVGDALQTLAFEIISTNDSNIDTSIQIKMINILATAAGITGMVTGQARELAATKNITTAEISQIDQEKTATLFQAALQLGTVIAPNYDANAMIQLGTDIGLAFQLQDDLLEYENNTTNIGKPHDSDQRNQTPTMAKIIGKKATLNLIEKHFTSAMNIVNSKFENPQPLLKLIATIQKRKI